MSEPWLAALAAEAAQRGQGEAARLIGYRPSVVSQVLSGTYRGDVNAVRRAVEGAFLGATVECPVLGEIPAQRCGALQRQPFAATTPERVKLWRACRGGCPHSRLTARAKEEGDAA